MPPMIENEAAGRFEIAMDEGTVFADVRRVPGRWIIDHVEAPPVLRGTGAASTLMTEIANRARAEGVRLTPLCSYAAAWLHRHAEHRDLVAGGSQPAGR